MTADLHKLRSLLQSDDAATRQQGIELAEALGDEVIAQLIARARITPKSTSKLLGVRWLARYLPNKIPQVVAPSALGAHAVQTTLALAARSQCRTARKLCSVPRLGLNGNRDLLDLAPLRELQDLKLLALVQARSFAGAEALARLPKLEKLFVAQIDELDLADLPPTLREVFAHSSKRNEMRVRLDGLPNLVQLVVRNETFRLDAAALRESANMKTLAIATMRTTLVNRSELSEIRLQSLELLNADVTDVAWIPSTVRTLRLAGAAKLVDLTGLARLTKLERLDLSNTAIDDWRPIAALPALEQLCVQQTKLHGNLPPALEAKCKSWHSKWT